MLVGRLASHCLQAGTTSGNTSSAKFGERECENAGKAHDGDFGFPFLARPWRLNGDT